MKFQKYTYWKHKNCMDVFFSPWQITVDDKDKIITLTGTWLTQGTEGWWCLDTNSRIHITPEEYDNWNSYSPKGEPR